MRRRRRIDVEWVAAGALNLYLDRRPGKKVLLKQFPAIRDQWEKGVDLFKFEKRLVSSLEHDLKRAPCNPRMIGVASRRRSHISLDTRPWATVEEFDSARATLDAWRVKRCLKTIKDWQSLDEAIQLGLIRSRCVLRGSRRSTLSRVSPPAICYVAPSCGRMPMKRWGWLRPTAIRHWRGG